MKTIQITLLLIISTISFSCGENNHTEVSVQDIEMNNGAKWTVNEEMTPFIKASEKLIENYDKSDYKILAQDLKDNNSKLIKSCTMDGKSHDELQKWLAPHLGLVKALGKAENKEEANEVIENLEKSFEIYNKYFQ